MAAARGVNSMIPPFQQSTGNLPPGIHEASWEEFVDRYSSSERRRALLDGIAAAIAALQRAGCGRIYIDVSFVTNKDDPGDFDACWEMTGVDLQQLDPVLLTFDAGRTTQKARFGGELFPAEWPADLSGRRFLEFFQQDRRSLPKGIVSIDLRV